jgi:DNA-binding MarR family transcriptional regulator
MSHEERAPSGQYAAMQEVFDEAVSLFHLLRALAARLHGQGEMTAARRGILRGLDRLGPQSVPQMARARPVSRQHIQVEVNQLEAEGLVELIENAAHKRSRLVRVTPKGKAYLEAMNRREVELFNALALAIPEESLRSTAETLHALRARLAQAHLHLSRAGPAHSPQAGSDVAQMNS